MKYVIWVLLLIVSKSLFATTFQYKDWELACDNTLTCRAAGYNSQQDDKLVSVLLTRQAGKQQPITGKVKIAEHSTKLQPPFSLALWVNQKRYGNVNFDSDEPVAPLSQYQVDALVSALAGSANIELTTKHQTWQLSDKGSTAIFIKMDEAQGRTKTPSAMIHKGSMALNVLSSKSPPVVTIAPIDVTSSNNTQTNKTASVTQKHDIREAIRKSIKATDETADSCEMLFNHNAEPLHLSPLSSTKILASTLCWRGAYNAGSGYWVLNKTKPYHPILVTTSATGYDQGKIESNQKGRGLGDCWSFEEQVWDGTTFVTSKKGTTGMCRLFSGGAWTLPTIVSHVK